MSSERINFKWDKCQRKINFISMNDELKSLDNAAKGCIPYFENLGYEIDAKTNKIRLSSYTIKEDVKNKIKGSDIETYKRLFGQFNQWQSIAEKTRLLVEFREFCENHS